MAPQNSTVEEVVVEMSDTDMSRFIHFASVVEYFEVGLRSMMDRVGYGHRDLFGRGIGMPVVSVSCDYESPMFFGDSLRVETRITEFSPRSVTFAFTLTTDDGQVTARGNLTSAFYDIDSREPTALPDDIAEAFESVAD